MLVFIDYQPNCSVQKVLSIYPYFCYLPPTFTCFWSDCYKAGRFRTASDRVFLHAAALMRARW
jgi:hypothetical protein